MKKKEILSSSVTRSMETSESSLRSKLSRRRFLGNSATALAAVSIVPANVLGGYSHPAPSERVGMAQDRVSESDTIRIRAGVVSDFTDARGRVWLKDTGFIGGKAIDRGDIEIATVNPQEIYRTERVSAAAYEFEVRNGRYTILLHMVENDHQITGPGQRVFNVTIGNTELKDIDIWNLSGGLHIPLVFAFPVTVTDCLKASASTTPPVPTIFTHKDLSHGR